MRIVGFNQRPQRTGCGHIEGQRGRGRMRSIMKQCIFAVIFWSRDITGRLRKRQARLSCCLKLISSLKIISDQAELQLLIPSLPYTARKRPRLCICGLGSGEHEVSLQSMILGSSLVTMQQGRTSIPTSVHLCPGGTNGCPSPESGTHKLVWNYVVHCRATDFLHRGNVTELR